MRPHSAIIFASILISFFTHTEAFGDSKVEFDCPGPTQDTDHKLSGRDHYGLEAIIRANSGERLCRTLEYIEVTGVLCRVKPYLESHGWDCGVGANCGGVIMGKVEITSLGGSPPSQTEECITVQNTNNYDRQIQLEVRRK